MDRHRRIAIAVGIFYIIGTVAGILSVILSGAVLDASDALAQVAAQPNRLLLAGLCVLAMGLSLAMVAIIIYPLLRQHNQSLAIGYVVFRGSLETTTYMATVIAWFLLIAFARESAGADLAPAAGDVATGATLRAAGDWIGAVTAIVFSIGALMLYSVFLRSRLIPAWLSGWGIIAILLHLPAALLVLFGALEPFSTPQVLLNVPIAVQEMVMAVWLIARGFRPVEPARAS